MIKTIVIDDEQYVTSLFADIVDWADLGFEISETFSSATDALEWLRHNECDVIFTDIAMPGLSGTELAKICHLEFPNILLVFFSAYRNFDYALDAIKYNVFDYIIKPISYTSLLETVARIKNAIKNSTKDTMESLQNNNDIIQTAIDFIKEHYCEDISVVDVANHVCLSPGYFSTYYKQKTNENFVVTLKNMRLEKAKELLKNKSVKISLIPYQIGFKSYSYFTKVFQQKYGLTPSDYRIKILNSDN